MLGVTGVEDLLQNDVKQCIVDFKEAGCKVWILTGDKGATAN
jgi:P-type E1-E2 ATPase